MADASAAAAPVKTGRPSAFVGVGVEAPAASAEGSAVFSVDSAAWVASSTAAAAGVATSWSVVAAPSVAVMGSALKTESQRTSLPAALFRLNPGLTFHSSVRYRWGHPRCGRHLISVFSDFYFGGDPNGDPSQWKGWIGNEPLLVDSAFFASLSSQGWRWGFVSGAEPPSARFVLQQRLGLIDPPLIAMGDAPDKPDPTGLIRLAEQLAAGEQPQRIAYIGDTVADVTTVINARTVRPDLPWQSLAVSPPHVENVTAYQRSLRRAGADRVLNRTLDLLALL